MKKKESEFLTQDEVEAILRVPDRRTLQGRRDYAILLTMLSTGLRKAELCGIKVKDIKAYRNQAVVDVKGKGGKFRRIPLKGEALKAIQDYLKISGNGHPDHALFHTLGKYGPHEIKPLTPRAVDCLIGRVRGKVLITKRITPHTTRHTFCTSLLDQGVDLKTCQSLMGHSHIRTTEVYLHTSTDKMVDAINRLQFG